MSVVWLYIVVLLIWEYKNQITEYLSICPDGQDLKASENSRLTWTLTSPSSTTGTISTKKGMLSIATLRMLGFGNTMDANSTTKNFGIGFVQGIIQFMSVNTTRQTISSVYGRRGFQRRVLVESQHARRLLRNYLSITDGGKQRNVLQKGRIHNG